MVDEELRTRIKSVVDNLSFRIGDLTLMYEHEQVDPDDFYKEVSCIKSDFVESIMNLVREHEGSVFRQSFDGLAVGDKVYFAYRDERKSNPDRYGLGVVVAGGVTEDQHTTRLLDGLFVISKTRKVTKVIIEMKDGENTERFLRRPSECLKAVDGGSSDA